MAPAAIQTPRPMRIGAVVICERRVAGPVVKARLRRAWASEKHALALDALRVLAAELERSIPAPPARCARAWRRRSRSPACRSVARSSAPCSRRTRSSR
jgi:hypothetical protein